MLSFGHRRKEDTQIKTKYCDASIPTYRVPNSQDYDDTKEPIIEKLKEMKKHDNDDCTLVINDNEQ